MRWVLIGVSIMVAASAPLVADSYWLRVLAAVFLYGTIASAINLMAGYTGYPAFGNVVFFGLGAYASGIVMGRLNGSLWSGLGLGVLVCAVYAIVIGVPVLRLRGHYFAIATLGMNEATRRLVENLSSVTGGGMGLALPIPSGDSRSANTYVYFLTLGLIVACLACTAALTHSRLGYGCRAIRFDEDSAANCGIPTMRYKLTMWIISASFTSLAGGIYAHWLGYIEPATVFDMTIAVKCFVMALLGGLATVLGPLGGALVVEMLSLMAWSALLTYHTAALGLLVMVVILLVPEGLSGLVAGRYSMAASGAGLRKKPTATFP